MTLTYLAWLTAGITLGVFAMQARQNWPTPARLRSNLALGLTVAVIAVVMTPVLLWGLALALWDLGTGWVGARQRDWVNPGWDDDGYQTLDQIVAVEPEPEWVEPQTVDDVSALLERIGVAAEPVARLTVAAPLVGNPYSYRPQHLRVEPYLELTQAWPVLELAEVGT